MALRAELSQPVAPGGDLDAARRFQGLFEVRAASALVSPPSPATLSVSDPAALVHVAQELAEDEMGEAAARCRAAGYEEEFCHSVLKVRPTAM